MRIILIFLAFFGNVLLTLAQTDTEFWFVAPAVTADHGDRPILFCFTTTDVPADVLVQMPDNPFWVDTIIRIPAFTAFRWNVTHRIDQIEHNYTADNGITGKGNKGIFITTRDPLCANQGEITAYYEVSRQNNPEIFVLKGRNALGTEFFTSFQTWMKNMHQDYFNMEVPPYSAADIVFTEPNTYITLEIPDGKKVFPNFTGVVTIGPFNPGETYSIAPAWVTNIEAGFTEPGGELFGRSAEDHLAGVRVTTNGKKIAITLKDDSMKALVGGCYDLGGDQTIPVNLTGTMYIAMRGQLTTGNLQTGHYFAPPANPVVQEGLFITATDDNTDIFINSVYRTTLQRGQTYSWAIPLTDDFTIVEARDLITGQPDSGIYVLQLTGFGCEFGEAILPPLSSCTGSTQIGLTRSTSEGMFLNIMVRKNAKAGFLLNGAYHPMLNDSVFTDIEGTDWAVALIGPVPEDDIEVGIATRISNSMDVFHLGMINGGSSSGVRYGYFSDYSGNQISVYLSGSGSDLKKICYGDSVQIIATGGTVYHWEPETYLDNPNIRNPIAKPSETIRYIAFVGGACGMADSIAVTIIVSNPINISIETDTLAGCSPLHILFDDSSRYVHKYNWYADGVPQETKYWDDYSDVILHTSYYKTFTNTGVEPDSISLVLVAKTRTDCSDTAKFDVVVLPQTQFSAMADTTIGSHPMDVRFEITSALPDSLVWHFGDNSLSYANAPVHRFLNGDTIPAYYQTLFTGFNSFGCPGYDTITIRVNPTLFIDFTADGDSFCTPALVSFTNLSSGYQTFFWDYADGSNAEGDPTPHFYANSSDTVQTYLVKLTGTDSTGIERTALRPIVVYPSVYASFMSSTTEGESPLLVDFTNASGGAVQYRWFVNDTLKSTSTDWSYVFINSSDSHKVFKVELIALNDFECIDSTTRWVTVTPFTTDISGVDFSDMSVYPVPVSDKVHLNLTSDREAIVNLRITDVAGTQIVVEEKQLQSGANTFSIPLQGAPGVYFLEICMNENRRVIKLVKN